MVNKVKQNIELTKWGMRPPSSFGRQNQGQGSAAKTKESVKGGDDDDDYDDFEEDDDDGDDQLEKIRKAMAKQKANALKYNAQNVIQPKSN